MKATGRLMENVPYADWHGQGRIWFQHPHFNPEETERLLTEAFRYDYDTLGPSLIRMCDTYLRGYRTLALVTRTASSPARREALRRRAGSSARSSRRRAITPTTTPPARSSSA